MAEEHMPASFAEERCSRCGCLRLRRRDGSPGVCSGVRCPTPFVDVDRERAEALSGARVEGF